MFVSPVRVFSVRKYDRGSGLCILCFDEQKQAKELLSETLNRLITVNQSIFTSMFPANQSTLMSMFQAWLAKRMHMSHTLS